eukprot:6215985-Pyramimonas_sp.AAC.1
MSVGYNEQFNALATIVRTATVFLPDGTTLVAQLLRFLGSARHVVRAPLLDKISLVTIITCHSRRPVIRRRRPAPLAPSVTMSTVVAIAKLKCAPAG